MKESLPRFFELAFLRLADLSPRDKNIVIKVSRNTARMMAREEQNLIAEAPAMLDMLQSIHAYFYEYRNGDLSGYEHELAGQVSAILHKIEGE